MANKKVKLLFKRDYRYKSGDKDILFVKNKEYEVEEIVPGFINKLIKRGAEEVKAKKVAPKKPAAKKEEKVEEKPAPKAEK